MTRLVWDDPLAREYRAGVDRGVVYPKIGTPVPWNGLVSVGQRPENADHQVAYFDGQMYVQRKAVEGFSAEVEAITYPDQIGTGKFVDLSWRVQADDGDEIHLVYNARLIPSDLGYSTLDDGTQAHVFKWSLTTVPETIDQVRATSHVVLNAADTAPGVLTAVTDLIYGNAGVTPRIPHLPELRNLYEAGAILQIVDHGDGTWTATGPDSMVYTTGATSFEINSPSAIWQDSVSYKLSNW
jgi:hypothetical protein